MKISVISPVLNEVEFIGYSAMAVLPYVHEILYGLADSSDGTTELAKHVAAKYGKGKIKLLSGGSTWNFDPMDMKAYDDSYNALIEESTGDAVWFLHPDMIVTNPEAITKISSGPLAWVTHVESYAGDLTTKITRGRAKRWKNIHAKQFGLHYYGGYGSGNEDFYFKDITGTSYRHYGQDFAEYPFDVADSGVHLNHYCEMKTYARRFEKMVRCLRTLYPNADEAAIKEWASQHPRVTLQPGPSRFGTFEFNEIDEDPPEIFAKYKSEFESFKNQEVPWQTLAQ